MQIGGEHQTRKDDATNLVVSVERDGEAVRNVENAALFEAAEQNADDAFDVSDFTRAVEVIDNAEQHQRVDNHLKNDIILFRIYARISFVYRSSHQSIDTGLLCL